MNNRDHSKVQHTTHSRSDDVISHQKCQENRTAWISRQVLRRQKACAQSRHYCRIFQSSDLSLSVPLFVYDLIDRVDGVGELLGRHVGVDSGHYLWNGSRRQIPHTIGFQTAWCKYSFLTFFPPLPLPLPLPLPFSSYHALFLCKYSCGTLISFWRLYPHSIWHPSNAFERFGKRSHQNIFKNWNCWKSTCHHWEVQ